MNKLAWIGLFIAIVGDGLWVGAGIMEKDTASLIGFLLIVGGALIIGIALLKKYFSEKRGLR